MKWYNANKGFGFIAPDRGGKDIFVHASVLERSGIMGLAEAQRVAVDVADGQKGPEAVGLRGGLSRNRLGGPQSAGRRSTGCGRYAPS